jgi:hypothetical protein
MSPPIGDNQPGRAQGAVNCVNIIFEQADLDYPVQGSHGEGTSGHSRWKQTWRYHCQRHQHDQQYRIGYPEPVVFRDSRFQVLSPWQNLKS